MLSCRIRQRTKKTNRENRTPVGRYMGQELSADRRTQLESQYSERRGGRLSGSLLRQDFNAIEV
jgi:hypothetical protein